MLPQCVCDKHTAVGLLEIKHLEGQKKKSGKGC